MGLAVIPDVGRGNDVAFYRADFEAPSFTPGDIGGQQGWVVDQGRAEITAGAGLGGSAGLVLLPSDPFSQARLRLKAPVESESRVSFVDLQILPVAGPVERREEMIDVNSARVGLFRTEDPKAAALWVFDGGESGKGWLETGVRLPVEEKTGRCSGFHRLTLREDINRQIWDVWVDGVWAAANVGFEEYRKAEEAVYIFMGDRTDPIALDDLAISPENPLGQDTDRDGLPDDLEKTLGSDPLLDDRDADADADGGSNLVQWAAASLGGDNRPLIAESELPVSLTLSRSSGLADVPFQVKLGIEGKAVEIRYTLDGSVPGVDHGLVLNIEQGDGIMISGSGVLRVAALGKKGRLLGQASAVWIFPADVARFTRPDGFPSVLFSPGGLVPLRYGPATGSEPEVEAVTASLKAAPIVVISAPEETFFDSDRGFYAASKLSLKAEVRVTMLRTGGLSAGPAFTATASLSGQSSLNHTVTPKHSIRIKPLPNATNNSEGGQPVSGEFVLRHPTQDSWVQTGLPAERREALYFADAMASAVLTDAGHPSLSHRFVHVFLNGAYWGVYDAVSQMEEGSGKTLLKGEKDGTLSAIFGKTDGWSETLGRLTALADAVWQGEPEVQGWEQAASAVDQDNLIDYILTNLWLGNRDWPVNNFLITRPAPAAPFQFLSWDAEQSLRVPGDAPGAMLTRIREAPDGPAAAFTRLSAWPAFRQRVLERARRLFTEGALSPENAAAGIQTQASAFRPLAALEAARWSAQFDPFETSVLPAWEKRVDGLLNAHAAAQGPLVMAGLEEWAALIDRVSSLAAEQNAARRAQLAAGSGQSVTQLRLKEITDRDGDGMPDAWEIRFGFDPDDPADAGLDADNDGILNRDELVLGLDPRVRDDVAKYLPPAQTSVFTRMQAPTIRRGLKVRELWEELPQLLPLIPAVPTLPVGKP